MTTHPSVLVVAPRRLALGLYSTLAGVVTNLVVLVWDSGLAIYNILAPDRHPERVVPAGYIGENGVWPPYVAPEEGDSRCSCPALNAMANHGAYNVWVLSMRPRGPETLSHTRRTKSPAMFDRHPDILV